MGQPGLAIGVEICRRRPWGACGSPRPASPDCGHRSRSGRAWNRGAVLFIDLAPLSMSAKSLPASSFLLSVRPVVALVPTAFETPSLSQFLHRPGPLSCCALRHQGLQWQRAPLDLFMALRLAVRRAGICLNPRGTRERSHLAYSPAATTEEQLPTHIYSMTWWVASLCYACSSETI